MRPPSSYLPPSVRSAVRFVIVGLTGTVVQTLFFMWAMWCLGEPAKNTFLYYVAFGIGFVLEMIPNYFISSWYTFGTRPTKKNAAGFLLARALNLVIQFGFLPLLVYLLPDWNDGNIGFVVIMLAGVINYLVLLLFFKKKPSPPLKGGRGDSSND
jgi:putative flippase GtrA